MGVVVLLLAFAVGAGAAAVFSIFGFMAVLTLIFIVGSLLAVTASDRIVDAFWGALALFVSAQVGYVVGLAALSRWDRRRNNHIP